MQQMAVKFGDIPIQDVSYIVTDEESVRRFNVEFAHDQYAYDSFIFLKNGIVYACQYAEPASFDMVWRVQ